MNLILLLDQDLAPDGKTARLEGRRAKHVREVHRAQVGDSLSVGLLGGKMGTGKVVSADRDQVLLELALGQPPPAPPGIDLLLAMPRPKILRKVLQAISSAGVKRVVLLNSYRVEKSYFDSPLLEPEAIREELLLGLEQGRDTALPQVEIRRLFKPFVEDELASIWPAEVPKLLAHPTAPQGLEGCRAGEPGSPAVLAIGPEGGWIPYEAKMLEERGFAPFSLGPRILRVDVAVPFLLGQLELWRRVGAA